MSTKLIYFVSVVLLLGSVVQAEDIKWTDLGADHLWSTPENWDLGRVPTLADEVLIDVPAAAAPNGPVIQDGIDAKVKGLWTEAPGEPTLTITGGTLEVAEWIWWGDGADSFGIWDMSGGAVTVGSEFELGWGGGAGTLTMTGGTISAAEAVIPTGSGAFGTLYLYGGTYNVTNADGLSVKENGLIDITEGTLVLEGDDTAKVNDLIAAGQITAYGGDGQLELDFDGRNPGKTTLTAAIEKTVLFAEDFEGLALGPNVDESLAGDAVWTDTPPEGWIVDESGIPGISMDATDGITEWAGWAFADKAWWIEAAGDQDRSLFELGSGIVAVADPDEWDDGERLPIPIAVDPYDTWLTTPAIKIAGVEAGTLELKFDSSWRPEFDDNLHQTANITASFDGGEPVVVMLWESDEASANYKPYATNETVIVKLDNPEGAKKVVLTFGLFDAGNDWWWAIDNVEVRGVVPDLGPVKPSTEGLVAYYALDGDATDSSGNGLNGTLVGDAAFAEGMVGMALDLDGDGDYVDCSNNALFSITDAFTLSVWINWRATGATWQTVVAKGDNAWRLARGGDTQTMDFGFTAGGTRGWQAARTASEVPLGEWHHVVATIDTTDGAKIYLDGVLEGENPDTGGITVGDYPAFIGENPQALNRFWNGLIDEVMIYSRVLSEAEIRYLAGERATPVDPGTDGLLAFFPLENDTLDASGNGNDGIIDGDPIFVDGPAGLGMAMEFDGDDHVDTGNVDDLAEWTIGCWAKSPVAPSGDSPSGPVHREKNYQFNWNHSNETFRASVTVNAGGWHAASLGTLEADTWYYLAGTYDGEVLNAYKDGELITANDAPSGVPVAETETLKLARHATAVQYFTGTVDEAIVYSRALSAGEIRYLAGFRPMDNPGTDNLAAAYIFDADAADSSGNALDGTLLGDAHAADGVLVLDGNDDAVAIPGIGDGLTEFTFVMKVFPTVDQMPLQFSGGINTDSWGGGIHLKLNNGKINVGVNGLAGGDVVGTSIIEPDMWTHLALTVSPDEVAVYVNGEKEGSRIGEVVPAVNVGAATIGAWNNGGTDVQREMTGMMDDVLIYNRALTEAEIRYLANN